MNQQHRGMRKKDNFSLADGLGRDVTLILAGYLFKASETKEALKSTKKTYASCTKRKLLWFTRVQLLK